jgi:uncharacterized protein (TIGR00730 family)
MEPKKSDLVDVEQNLARLKNAPSYRMSTRDPDFLEGDDGREARLLSEFLKAERALEHENIASTIIVFGSARIPDPKIAKERLDAARQAADAAPGNKEKAEKLERAKRTFELSEYYQIAREFGELVARENDKYNEVRGPRGEVRVKKDREYVVCTGGGPGVMEAANRGAYDAGEASIGLNISLPFEQEPNPFVAPHLCFNFHYFAMRKMHFLLRAKALVIFPGGFGTLDELFEALTLRQTGRMQDLPIVMFGQKFWENTINFQNLVDSGVISPHDLDLFVYVKTAREAWEHIDAYYKNK